jgi:cytochrome bd-type quinol oxidase subunit 1
VIAYSRPFLPLFLHVLGAMTLVGALLVVALVAWVAWRKPEPAVLRRAASTTLLVVALPAYVVMRVAAQWIYSKEDFSGKNDPTWLGIGFAVADMGLLLLLVLAGLAFWWRRSGKAVAGRIVAGLSTVYLALLALAWLAMSGKWG